VWFGDVPVAQENVGGSTQWTVTDDLRAPILQTSATGATSWQAVYTPYGAIYSLATADAHQPLRRPGQEAEEFTTGNPNGLTNRFYNGFRWYRPAYGRYTQAAPVGYASGAFSLYTYASSDPLNALDPYGLDEVGETIGGAILGILGAAGADFCAAAGEVLGGPPGAIIGTNVGGIAGYALGRHLGAGVDLNPFTLPGASCAADGGGATGSLGTSAVGGAPGEPGTGQGGGGPGTSNAPSKILMPSGSSIGSPGTSPDICELSGTTPADAQNLFNKLAQGGTPYSKPYAPNANGVAVNLPNGGFIGMRTGGTNSPGTLVTIDLNIPNIPISKITFNP
jgi:RHS repeat-associated protein